MKSFSVKFVFAKFFIFMVDQISRVASGNAEPARMGMCRMSSLDVMKCFAAFCVVWIHFGSGWLSPVTRCAVPVFFVITGYYYPMMVEKGKFWRHIRKLLVMVLCASALYGAITLTSLIRHDTLGEWANNTFRLRHIVGLIVLDQDLFAFHLWYFYAVLYDLIIFYLADKWKLAKWLRYATPILLFIFLMSNFTPWNNRFRNFLFMGLPCMMIGRMIREKKDTAFSFLEKKQYLWVYACVSLLMIGVEMCIHYCIQGKAYVNRETFIFTLPLFLPFFYAALRNPTFGEGSIWASIGRKYSAYIYIFHVFAGTISWHIVKRNDSLLAEAIYPFLVFAISLLMAWAFVKVRQKLNISRNDVRTQI